MNQEDINKLLWNSCPEWKKEQLQAQKYSQRYSQKEILTNILIAKDKYELKREFAAQILEKEGMEEAIIDELEAMGFQVIAAT